MGEKGFGGVIVNVLASSGVKAKTIGYDFSCFPAKHVFLETRRAH
jgi:hypothetical protein